MINITITKNLIYYNPIICNNFNFLLIYTVQKILKKYLVSLYFFSFYILNINLNYIKFYFIKENLSYIFDNIQSLNSIIKYFLLCYFKFKTTLYFYKLNLITTPYIFNTGSLLLNGLKRIFISKLINKKNLYFIKYKKGTSIIVAVFFNLTIKTQIFIELNTTTFEITYFDSQFNIKINLILFLYILGITYKLFAYFCKYSTNFIYYYFYKNIFNKINTKKILYYIKYIKNIFLFKFLLNNKHYNFKDLLSLIEFLIDFHYNKKTFNIKNNFTIKYLYTLDHLYTQALEYKLILFNKILKKNKFSFTKLKSFININILNETLFINPLLRLLEDINLLTEYTNHLKILNLGLTQTITSTNSLLTYRDIHPSQLTKICLINTTEGPSSGLLLSLLYPIINKNNFLKTVLYTTDNFFLTEIPISINIAKQETYKLNLTNNLFKKYNYSIKFKNIKFQFNEFQYTSILKTTSNIYLDFTNTVSLLENLIPFLLYNDPARNLMGAKMQSQAIPLIWKQTSKILTGFEFLFAKYSINNIVALQEAIIIYVSNYKIIARDIFNREITYYLTPFKFTNTNLILIQKPLVWVGERIIIGQLLTDTISTFKTELSLGNPALVLYGSYYGFDYEDALIVSQKLIYNNIFSSLHINIYETSFIYNDTTWEYSTLNIPNLELYKQRHLNIFGIIKEGCLLLDNDILISKISESPLTLKTNKLLYKFLNYLFGINLLNIQNNSSYLPLGNSGRVLKTEIFIKLKEKNFNIQNTYFLLRIFIGKLRILELGDKLCGRHGNKGIISYISNISDLPYSISEGIFPDIITGSLGVPSRLNIGQLYEGVVGLSSFYLDTRIQLNSSMFFGVNSMKLILYNILYKISLSTSFRNLYNSYLPLKILFREGRCGSKLKNSLFMGILQYFKLIHMVKDKFHYRTIGLYTELTQQPIKGRSKGGGQRFGEMEVWALEAFGAAYLLKELLNSRSDDIKARLNLYTMYSNLQDITYKTTISETFKLICKELQGLSLNINTILLYPNIDSKKYISNIYNLL